MKQVFSCGADIGCTSHTTRLIAQRKHLASKKIRIMSEIRGIVEHCKISEFQTEIFGPFLSEMANDTKKTIQRHALS